MKTLRNWFLALTVLLLVPGLSYAQDEGEDEDLDDVLEDILKSDDDEEESVADERKAVITGDLDDRAGVRKEEITTPEEEEERTRRLIKTLQRKTFLKIGRFEAAPFLGFVTNDVFINRYILGGSITYHPTEVFAASVAAAFSPDFGEADWKPITRQLVTENQVSPDISKIYYYIAADFKFSPIYGKVAVLGKGIVNFDVFGLFGTGMVHTLDDLKALQAEGDPVAEKTASQNHAITNVGGGIRVLFPPNFGFTLEGRSMIYIETVNSVTLEMKGNMLLLGSFSFFFPGMK